MPPDFSSKGTILVKLSLRAIAICSRHPTTACLIRTLAFPLSSYLSFISPNMSAFTPLSTPPFEFIYRYYLLEPFFTAFAKVDSECLLTVFYFYYGLPDFVHSFQFAYFWDVFPSAALYSLLISLPPGSKILDGCSVSFFLAGKIFPGADEDFPSPFPCILAISIPIQKFSDDRVFYVQLPENPGQYLRDICLPQPGGEGHQYMITDC